MKRIVFVLVIVLASSFAFASDDNGSLWTTFINNVSETFKNPQSYDIYIPVYMYHNRLFYDKDRIDRYNEIPIGAGFALSRETDLDVEHSLFILACTESKKRLQITTGYLYQKKWYNDKRDWFVSAGFTAFFIQRYDYYYIPIPLLLPAGGIGYKNVSLEASYIPGPINDGNVLFVWLRLRF